MSAEPLLARWMGAARVRGALDDVAVRAPAVLAAAALAWRLVGPGVAVAVLAIGGGAVAVAAWRRARRFGAAWLVRRLDGGRADLESSADLLFADPAAIGPLQRLQRARVEARLAEAASDPRPAWSTRTIAVAWAAGLAATAAILLWPVRHPAVSLAPALGEAPAAPGVPRLVGQRLRVIPPAYTGAAARDLDVLDVRAPQGSRLVWTLAFAPRPRGAALRFLDGRAVALAGGPDGRWTAAATLDRSALYRVVPSGTAAATRLHRVEAVADRPPTVVALAPAHPVSAAAPGQRRWALLFQATDDYGVQPTALLRLTLATGEGEQVKFAERTVAIHGTGPPRLRRFAASLDLAALGFTGTGDLVAQLDIADARAPAPQHVRSASLILRRSPPVATGETGMQGLLHAALPTALRSERQVINDAEALLRGRAALPAPRFLARAQAIGGDQQALRDRYGSMLGQETDSADDALPTSDAPVAGPVGREVDVMAKFGEEKEDPEADTLYDRSTHARLQAIVDEMWRAETAFKEGNPAAALPFANRALVLLKAAQRVERVFLAHVSAAELPPIDETRRLTGKRDDLGPDPLALPPREGDERAATAAWAAVGGLPGRAGGDGAPPHSLPGGGADPLAYAAALDSVRRDPGCAACRARLRALVWAAVPRPPPEIARRPAGDAAGRRYLQALGAGRR